MGKNQTWMEHAIIKKKERSQLVDIAKGIAIVLVVLGHSVQYGSGTEFLINKNYFDNLLYRFIYSFHMPLFMMISGFFFSYTVNKNSLKELLFSRITKLVIPIFIWNGLFYLAHFGYNLHNATLLEEIALYLESSFYALWFIWAIFWCSLIVSLVNKYFGDNIYLYFVVFLITLFIPDIINFPLYSFMYPSFVIGFLFNKHRGLDLYNKLKIKRVFVIIFVSVLYLFLMLFYNSDSFIYNSGYSIIDEDPLWQLAINIYRLFVGICGSIIILLSIDWLIEKYKFFQENNKMISELGIESLGIYIISGYFFLILERITVESSFNYGAILLQTVIILTLSYFATILLKRFRIARILLLGGR
jgi:fucose 4-O-acetylase-like acetyltransferase